MTTRRALRITNSLQRRAWILFHDEKMDTVDIARALFCSEAEVDRKISRVLELRQLAWRSA